MPRYFFHVHDGEDRLDNDGTVFAVSDEACAEAVVTAGEILRDYGKAFWSGSGWRMWVTNEAGDTVCALKVVAEPPR